MSAERTASGAVALVLLGLVSGCVSASLEDAAPVQAVQPDTTTGEAPAAEPVVVEEAEVRDNSFVEEGALRNDAFPTFEKFPQTANKQLSDEEKQALLDEMKALKAAMKRRGAASAVDATRYQELQELAREHAAETIKQIEQ